MSIDISDLDRKVLLKALWDNTITASFFKYNSVPPLPYEEPTKYNEYFDYHCGRPIKTDLSGDLKSVYTGGYNRNAGDNKFEEIVEKLRKLNNKKE
jgi:hypothetical protein